MNAAPTIECWFEFASTYSYIAVSRADARIADFDLSIEWRPFLLGAVVSEFGWRASPFNICQAKGQYMWRDMARQCEANGLPFRKPSCFPRSGLLAARIACGRMNEWWTLPFCRAVYHANFVEDREIEQRSVIEEILKSIGTDPEPLLRIVDTPDTTLLLRQQTEEAMNRGICGAPTFAVGNELFWGNDRLFDAISWGLRRWGDASYLEGEGVRTFVQPPSSAPF